MANSQKLAPEEATRAGNIEGAPAEPTKEGKTRKAPKWETAGRERPRSQVELLTGSGASSAFLARLLWRRGRDGLEQTPSYLYSLFRHSEQP